MRAHMQSSPVAGLFLMMATRQEILTFSIQELSDFLEKFDTLCPETLASLRNNRISGAIFLELCTSDLREIVTPLGDRKEIERIISSYTPIDQVSYFTKIMYSDIH